MYRFPCSKIVGVGTALNFQYLRLDFQIRSKATDASSAVRSNGNRESKSGKVDELVHLLLMVRDKHRVISFVNRLEGFVDSSWPLPIIRLGPTMRDRILLCVHADDIDVASSDNKKVEILEYDSDAESTSANREEFYALVFLRSSSSSGFVASEVVQQVGKESLRPVSLFLTRDTLFILEENYTNFPIPSIAAATATTAASPPVTILHRINLASITKLRREKANLFSIEVERDTSRSKTADTLFLRLATERAHTTNVIMRILAALWAEHMGMDISITI